MPPVNQTVDQTNPSSPRQTYSGHGGPIPGFDPNVPVPHSQQKHHHSLLIPFILTVVLLLAALGFGAWAFMERQDYKNKSDQKSAEAVTKAEAALTEVKEQEFAGREKEPLKMYKGPATFGSLEISYPKTWSAFITETDKGSSPIDGYLHPNYVPGLSSGTAFALHFQVTSLAYDQELRKFESAAKVGKVTISPTSVPKVPDVAGVRISGEIETGKQGTVVLFPVRDKTLKLISESTAFTADFDGIILKDLVFVP